ncbi:MAG: hypothetical protein GXW85_07560 [Clostridia bacterium]|nr:hypothetical protein [Clostridia bacterium]
MLIVGLISALIVAWFFALFGGDTLIIQGILELTGKEIGAAGYYTIFALLGLIGGAMGGLGPKNKD